MPPIPCPCCGPNGALTRHCSDSNRECPSWDRCVRCGSVIHQYRTMRNGIRQHSHPYEEGAIQPPDCKLCGPTWVQPIHPGAKP